MNTVTHSEVHALHAVAAAAAAAAVAAVASTEDQAITVPVVVPYELHLIALSKLRPSNRNVRKSGGTAIPELAASIVRVGLLQNLTVIATADGESFEVVAGKRRLAALKLLAKRRKLDRNHPVPCLLVPDASARTVSLTENVHRESMSPVDELFAWKALAAEGRALEDIAADFGVTPLVVKRRLKLANVSPRLLADYQADAVSLEQLMALAITDDHAAQEAAFYEAPQWQRSPDSLRDHLTHEEIDASRDAVARFVGVEAYGAAGGGIRRDLFSDEQGGVFLTDAGLLDALARDRLEAVAESAQAEGWGWVEVAPRATASELHAFQRARRTRREPNKAEAKRIAKLEAEQSKVQDKLDDELSDDGVQALHEELDRLGNALEAIEQTLMVYAPGVVSMAGAVVSVDHTGGVVVHRGLLREEQAKALRAQERLERREAGEGSTSNASGAEAGGPELAKAGISEKLAKRLSAHRTAALQAEVARHPHVALVAVVHQLAHRVILGGYGSTPLSITVCPQDRLTESLDGSDGIQRKHKLLLMLDEFPALGRLDFFESTLAFMAGYGLRAVLIAQSLNQIDKAYGQNHSILDNCHVRIAFATNDERTAKRISDSLGTATELRAQRNYAGHRLAPWLGHLMVSRQETARPLLTPGEVMQLPPDDAVVMVSGHPPIRAKKLRYYQDRNFIRRVLPAPVLGARPSGAYTDKPAARADDWSGLVIPAVAASPTVDGMGGFADEGGHQRKPELDITEETAQEPEAGDLIVFDVERDDDGTPLLPRDLDRQMDRQLMRTARLAAMDPDDGITL